MTVESSEYKSLCANCPTKASLEEAESMAGANEAFYKSPGVRAQAVGYIALLKEIHFDLRQTMDCKQPTYDDSNQLACPLEQSMKNTLFFMKGPGEESHYEYVSFTTPEISVGETESEPNQADQQD